ncbi:MAG: AMP-binding protein [Bdellovibrionia bacterium]
MGPVLHKMLTDFETCDFTIGDLLDEIASVRRDDSVLIGFETEGTGKTRREVRRSMTYGELVHASKLLATRLMTSGVRPGDRVALIRHSGPDWLICFFAILLCRAVALPVDTKLGTREILDIFKNAEPKAMITSSHFKDLLDQTARVAPEIIPIVLSLADLRGQRDKAQNAPLSQEIRSSLHLQGLHFRDLAVIVYTSGSTSSPKGVMARLSNLMFEVHAMLNTQPIDRHTKTLSILPPNHFFELCCGLLTPFFAGGQIVFSKSLLPEDIIDQICTEQVTDIVCVPLFLRMLRKGLLTKIARCRLTSAWFWTTFALARRIPSREARRLLFAPIHRQLGNSLKRFYCGGAPLEKEVAWFFETLGISPLAGYGLTETSPVVSINSEKKNRIGSVGRALPGVEVKTDSKGELLVRGPNVMMGYLNAPELTASVIDANGWFRTGDLGFIDEEGFIHITGRCKELIVLGNGKKVFPNEVEEMLAPLIERKTVKELCVVGARGEATQEEVCVVVVDPQLDEDGLRREIFSACQSYAVYKRPTRILVKKDGLPVTTTMKVNRARLKNWIEGRMEIVS